MKLNKDQRKVRKHKDGPLLVISVAGSGKTTAVCHRIAYLVQKCGVPGFRILATTFTRLARQAMNDRLAALGVKGVRVGTIHSVCYEILRRFGRKYGGDFEIRSNLPIKRLLAAANTSLPKEVNLDLLQSFISWSKSQGYPPSDFKKKPELFSGFLVKFRAASGSEVSELSDIVLAKVLISLYEIVERSRIHLQILTYDDILVQTLKLLQRKPRVRKRLRSTYKYILVDEFQDVNRVQAEILRILAAPRNNLCVVGDDDQAIYGFRGSDNKHILNFKQEYGAKVIRMQYNYRSVSQICDTANRVISLNQKRLDKKLIPARKPAEQNPVNYREYWDETEEAEDIVQKIRQALRKGLSPDKIAILYRSNRQSVSFLGPLLRAKIPYQVIGDQSLFEYNDVATAIAYLGLAYRRAKGKEQGQFSFFESTINIPKRGLGPAFIGKVMSKAKSQENASLFQVLGAIGSASQKPKILGYMDLINELTEIIRKKPPNYPVLALDSLMNRVDLASDTKLGESRLQDLRHILSGFSSLGKFLTYLQTVALEQAEDRGTEKKVSLMTVHKAKGLEFPLVFLPGICNGLFPHALSLGEPDGLEEERRLFYVAMTRGEECVMLSSFKQGKYLAASGKSQFLFEAEICKAEDSDLQAADQEEEAKARDRLILAGVF